MVYSLRTKKAVNYNVAKVLQKACREINIKRSLKTRLVQLLLTKHFSIAGVFCH